MNEPSPAQPARAGARRALLLLLAINLLNYLDRYLLAPLSIPIIGHYHLSDEQFGLLASVFLYAYMVGAPILGLLAVRMSRWWIVAGSVTVWSLASGYTGIAGSFTTLLVARVVVGIGEAGYGPSAPALISDYFAPERRGRVMALFYLAIPVGSALGYMFGGRIYAWFHHWQLAFWLVLPVGLVLAVLCCLMRDPGKHASDAGETQPFLREVWALYRIPSYIANTGAMTAMTFVIGGMSFWIPKYVTMRIMEERGVLGHLSMPADTVVFQNASNLQTQLIGDVSFTFGLIVVVAGFFSTFLGGWVGDRLRTRIRGAYLFVSGAAILVAFPCMLAMIWTPFPWAWIAIFGAVFFLFFNTGPANTALANVTSSSMRPTAFALNILVIHALGDAISPPLLGWLARTLGSWNNAFLLVAPLVLVASALWFIGSRYLTEDEQRALGKG